MEFQGNQKHLDALREAIKSWSFTEFNRFNEQLLEKGEHLNLRGAYLHATILREANLQRADLRWANLQGANLQKVDLQGANLQKVDLHGADLRGVDLRGAKNLDDVSLYENVIFDKNTKLSDDAPDWAKALKIAAAEEGANCAVWAGNRMQGKAVAAVLDEEKWTFTKVAVHSDDRVTALEKQIKSAPEDRERRERKAESYLKKMALKKDGNPFPSR